MSGKSVREWGESLESGSFWDSSEDERRQGIHAFLEAFMYGGEAEIKVVETWLPAISRFPVSRELFDTCLYEIQKGISDESDSLGAELDMVRKERLELESALDEKRNKLSLERADLGRLEVLLEGLQRKLHQGREEREKLINDPKHALRASLHEVRTEIDKLNMAKRGLREEHAAAVQALRIVLESAS